MKRINPKYTLIIILFTGLLTACNKLDDNPDIIGTWGASISIPEAHTLLISSDGTGHPYEGPCGGIGSVKVKLTSGNVLKYTKNGSTRKEYVVTTFPTVASEIIPFNTQVSCSPVEIIPDTIFPGEMYMILDESLYLKKQ